MEGSVCEPVFDVGEERQGEGEDTEVGKSADETAPDRDLHLSRPHRAAVYHSVLLHAETEIGKIRSSLKSKSSVADGNIEKLWWKGSQWNRFVKKSYLIDLKTMELTLTQTLNPYTKP